MEKMLRIYVLIFVIGILGGIGYGAGGSNAGAAYIFKA